MKRLILLTLTVLLGGLAPARAVSSIIPVGPVTFKLTAACQARDYQLIGTKTNHTSMATNITQSFSSTVTNLTIDTKFLLALLTNSLGTSFPADARLFGSGNFFYVEDSTETNLVNTTVLYVQLFEGVTAGPQSHITMYDVLGTTYADPESTTTTYDAQLNYNDSARSPTDGTHTVFSLRGQMVVKRTNKNDTLNGSFLFTVTGSGTIRDRNVLLKGTITGKGMDWPVF